MPKLSNIQPTKIEPMIGMGFGLQSKLDDDDPFAEVDR
jgi:hypothetical protein